MTKSNIIKGTYTSVWDSGAAVLSTKGTLNISTGAVDSLETVNVEGLENLDREYFTDMNGKEYEICTDCHSYITITEMVDDPTGKGIHEETRCKGECS